MTTSEMTDQELNIELMKLMGEEVIDYHGPHRHLGPRVVRYSPHYFTYFDGLNDETEHETNVRPYTESIDLLSAVEQRLIAAALDMRVAYDSDDGTWSAEWWQGSRYIALPAEARTEARARAEAALLALIAIEPTSITTLASRETP